MSIGRERLGRDGPLDQQESSKYLNGIVAHFGTNLNEGPIPHPLPHLVLNSMRRPAFPHISWIGAADWVGAIA